MKTMTHGLLDYWIVGLLIAGTSLGQISEPSTIFYGKVTGTGGAQPFLVQDGGQDWTIEKADGGTLVLNTELYPLNNGTLCYQLQVPHNVSAYDLESGDGLPLPPAIETNVHAAASVDGQAAVFCGSETFAVGQALRSATYRLDLEVPLVPPDADGDGMPDWWEDALGLDKQFVDSAVDSDGDGLANLQEYLQGLDPNADNTKPTLATGSLRIYPGCATGIRLQTDDLDSAPTNLVYSLLTVPTNGALALRNVFANPLAPDAVLTNGMEFSQADVDCGRLYFTTSSTNGGSFAVVVRDETTASATGTVELVLYAPGSGTAAQERALRAGLNDGAVIWDAVGSHAAASLKVPSSGLPESEYASVYVPAYGEEYAQAMLGGRGADTLSGGWGPDLIVGGAGTDAMSGGGGADVFAFGPGDLGADTIVDFSPDEGDTIDLDDLLAGTPGWMDDYLDVAWNGSGTVLGLDLAGGGTYTDLVVTLTGVRLDAKAVYDLVLKNQLLAGALKLMPRISVAATDAQASENGNNSGTFTLTREGDLGATLNVALAFGGAAVNGTDYSAIASMVTFAPGISEAAITINPISDSETEVDESVELTLQPGSGYVLHDNIQASVLIKDLQSVVEVTAWEPLGSWDPLVPATVLVKRNGPVANSLFVMLDIGGSARNGSDYGVVYSFVMFDPGQTVVPINIVPSVNPGDEPETVIVSALEDASYALADAHSARVILAARRDYLDRWHAREVPGNTDSTAVFAAGDAGALGIGNLARYAYGMDPLAPDASLLPQLVLRDGRCQVDVHRNPCAMDVEFEISASTNLLDWSTAPRVVVPELEDDATVETYQTDVPVGTAAQQYLRVKLIYEP
ncbi:Calx-beta domain-containing protein [Pontiella sp.]|uniref:Calx-beta domain-containing protein n=1 Tax=Pontiella sp. TaxID=2837462 RepID=UPI00356130D0